MSDEVESRRTHTEEKLRLLREKLAERATTITKEQACVYVMGSYGRGEASKHSDLDLFIAGLSEVVDSKPQRAFRQLDEVLLKAELIHAARSLELEDFSGDGEYLTHFAVHELVGNLGRREDDSTNTFTARLLLLLESRPIVGDAAYETIVRQVIAAYWPNFEKHRTDYVPGYLINDILRLWRTFCVNYEAGTKEKPDTEQAKRQLKHYKLQHSRLLTCYSGLLYLLGIHQKNGTVTPDDAWAMTTTRPLDRVAWLADEFPHAASEAAEVRRAYGKFLEHTSAPKDDLVAEILSKGHNTALPEPEPRLSKTIFQLIEKVGGGGPFHQRIVV